MCDIFKDERMYMSDSEGAILDINNMVFDDISADFLRKLFINTIDRYGFISVGDIIDLVTSSIIDGTLIKNPSYLSMKYGFKDYDFFKFELDREPKYPGDILWRLDISSDKIITTKEVIHD
jgi:hypothetical protein